MEFFPTGKGPHPTLIMLQGFTGMGGNTDVAGTICRAGWNVIFFRYRGCWGMPGEFTFKHCVEDAINLSEFCIKNSDSLNIDTARIAFWGHSMGGWVALKAAQQTEFVKKLFLLSTWDIFSRIVYMKNENLFDSFIKKVDGYIEIKISSTYELFKPVIEDSTNLILTNNLDNLKNKKIYMLDEHVGNKIIAEKLNHYAKSLKYNVWYETNHGFSNKRIAMMREVLSFLNE